MEGVEGGDIGLGNTPPPSYGVPASILALAELGRDIISALLVTLRPREWCLLTTPTGGPPPEEAPAPVLTGGVEVKHKLCGASGWSPEVRKSSEFLMCINSYLAMEKALKPSLEK